MTRRPPTHSRRGTFVPFFALTVAGLLMFIALAVDLSLITTVRAQSQNAADAAALAACRALNAKPTSPDKGKGAAETAANAVNEANKYIGGSFPTLASTAIKIGTYDYSTSNGRFSTKFDHTTTPSGWTAAQVNISLTQPTFFSKVFGVTSMPNGAYAVAVHRPRDAAMLLDFSGSMRHGTVFNNASNGAGGNGMNNPDPDWPQFGHYQRYTEYQTTNPNASRTGNDPGGRPNPLQMNNDYVTGAGETHGRNNYTIASPSGPAIVDDFITDPMAAAGSEPNFDYDAADNTLDGYEKAFRYEAGSTVGLSVPAPSTYKDQNDSSYNGDRWPRKHGYFANHSAGWSETTTNGAAVHAAEYLGWTARYSSGSSLPTAVVSSASLGLRSNSTTNATQGWTIFRDATWERYGYDLDVANYVSTRGANWDPRWDYNGPNGQTSGSYNGDTVGWKHYRSSNPSGSGIGNATSTTSSPIKLKGTTDRFKGYSMGPGFWGKTFFIWPPDPRWGGGTGTPNPINVQTSGEFAGVKDTNGNWICDWRRRFFYNRGGGALATIGSSNGAADNDTSTSGNQSINKELFTDGTQSGHTLTTQSENFQINYSAVLRWIKSGPTVFPPNLRAGRICYYTHIPNDVSHGTSGTNESPTSSANRQDLDKVFWKNYIDYVLAQGERGNAHLAGPEELGWPEPGTNGTRVTPDVNDNAPDGFIHGVASGSMLAPLPSEGAQTKDRPPYMNYTDNPIRPRLHFWFGPMSMMAFIAHKGNASAWTENMLAGTVKEAQSWQLKAAINSALDDIRYNHPNDFVGMSFFAGDGGYWQTPVVNCGQEWNRLKDSLFYPKTMLDFVRTQPNREYYPYKRVGSTMTYAGAGDMPNPFKATNPESSFVVAYNMLMPYYGGRRGANKIVIFETDGVPNSNYTTQPAFNSAGYNSYISFSGADPNNGNPGAGTITNPTSKPSGTSFPSGHPTSVTRVYGLIRDRYLPVMATTTSGTSGLSLANSPARVYSIAFGDLFEPTSTASQKSNASNFLLTVQKYAGTSDWADTSLPSDQIITGNYSTRISLLRSSLERIFQSGVQVTLIE